MGTRTSRRSFVKLGAAAASVGAVELAHALPAERRILVEVDERSPLLASSPVRWAMEQLRAAITPQHLASSRGGADYRIVLAPGESAMARPFGLRAALTAPETMGLVPSRTEPAVLATGSDARGMSYAVLELAERVRSNGDPVAALRMSDALVETSPNHVRSVARA